ncbi:MAG TPA: LemA family protein [candidate division Zixibacteria bacterium]|nr:LemA family protein [candidate division Zixibacteria bacterium]
MMVLLLLGLATLIVMWAVMIYNTLVRLRNTVRSSWSDIDVQLKKRYNLVPNLVETVKGYARHESSVFEKVTEARTLAMSAGAPGEQAAADNIFAGALKSLFAVAEAYPELKANDNFLNLQNQFSEIEGHIEAARRYYNAVVRDYNTQIEVFPAVIVANMFAFKAAEFYELQNPEVEREAPRADFS